MPLEKFEAKTERELIGKILWFCIRNPEIIVHKEITEKDYGRNRNGDSVNPRFEGTIHYERPLSS